jgi:hypothetical protein
VRSWSGSLAGHKWTLRSVYQQCSDDRWEQHKKEYCECTSSRIGRCHHTWKMSQYQGREEGDPNQASRIYHSGVASQRQWTKGHYLWWACIEKKKGVNTRRGVSKEREGSWSITRLETSISDNRGGKLKPGPKGLLKATKGVMQVAHHASRNKVY